MNFDILNELFYKIRQYLINKDEESFSSIWNTQAYNRNLAGIDSWGGSAFFKMLISKNLTLSPELNDIQVLKEPDAFIVGCNLLTESAIADELEYCYILISKNINGFELWAASENPESLEGLHMRLGDLPLTSSISQKEVKDNTEQNFDFLSFFNSLNETINIKNEVAFSKLWTSKAYYHNLSSTGGLSGSEFYTQAIAAQWNFTVMKDDIIFFEEIALAVPTIITLKTLGLEKKDNLPLFLIVMIDKQPKIIGYNNDLVALRKLFLNFKSGY